MSYLKTAILLAGLTGLFMGVGYLIGGQAGKQPRAAVYTPNLEATTDHRDPTAASPVVFKIHGDIGDPASIRSVSPRRIDRYAR